MNKYFNNNYRFKLLHLLAFLLLLSSSKTLIAATPATNTSAGMSNNMGTLQMPVKKGRSISGMKLDEVYACPMHPEETSHKPGSCAKCGMFLVKQNADTKSSEMPKGLMPAMDHSHSDSTQVYACSMHPEETSHKPGSCSKCGMFLVKQDTGTKDSKMKTVKMPAMNHQQSSSGMQHDKMQMKQQARPARYWDSQTESATTSHLQHNKSSIKKPVMQRMKPELATISGKADHASSEAETEHAVKHLDPTYICPMHPQIIQHEPGGNCPICGMNLVAKKLAAPTADNPQVFLPAAVIQNMGIRTEKVQLNTINKQIRTQGRVTADDERLLSIHSRTGGWIEVLHLVTEGDRVERKDELVDFYSPWINQVQLDYITALEEYDLTSFDPSRKVELGAKVDSLRNSLRLLNVMDMDIMRIRNSRKVQNTIQILAPQGGIITRLNVNEGSYVEPFDSMFTIVDLSEVWVMVDIYEHQAPWVRKGHQVEITAPAIPARTWKGVIDFIYPQVDIKTRTLRARIAIPNPDEALLLNMFVKVNINSNASKQPTLNIPREALIITGERQTVIKSMGKGHFQPVEVTTGKRGEGRVEILTGLQEGEEIVISGQFLIDSESSLQASFLRMSE